ncbi:peptidyl-tRNA hydrolase [Phellopilus nigrolimitatus]|nr:peptidyl-tRNA hydrolase [Phellopilus nigrolimitatus]
MQRILLVGIGNIPLPGTRHSVGHYILNSIASRCGYNMTLHDRLDGYFAQGETRLKDKPIQLSLFKPRPLMNIVGPAVKKACYATVDSPASMIVIQDTLHLEPGRVKVKFAGSAQGHGGIRSINDSLNHNSNYFRLLVGIGRGSDAKKYVLGALTSYEKRHWSADGEGLDEVWEYIETISEQMKVLLERPKGGAAESVKEPK